MPPLGSTLRFSNSAKSFSFASKAPLKALWTVSVCLRQRIQSCLCEVDRAVVVGSLAFVEKVQKLARSQVLHREPEQVDGRMRYENQVKVTRPNSTAKMGL